VGRGAVAGFDDERRVNRLLGWSVGIVLAAGVLSFLAKGADGPANPYFRADAAPTIPPTTLPLRSPVPGFGEVAFRVGSGPLSCGLLADTPAQRQRGLSGLANLAGHAGILFRYPSALTAIFTGRGIAFPLSMAWFDATGGFIGATDVVPCPNAGNCPPSTAPRPFRYALQVPQGGLGALGAGPGAQLVVGAGC
jgi:uncharacterized membrane protein (UPF0127 family)